MDEEEVFTEDVDLNDMINDLCMEYDDYPEFDSVEYTTDW